jgi:protocatechuate 3,4-dioxygenase beta subunit
MIGRALSPRAARKARTGPFVAACVGAAIGVLAIAHPPTEARAEAPSGSGSASCPSSNPPSALTLAGGTPQTAALGQAFATGLQVALVNSDGCPVTAAAGVPVTFSAPSSGASGLFSGGGSNNATVGSDASGMAAAPTLTANDAAGSYTVTAISQYGSVSFSLTNTAAGIPAKIVARPLRSDSARVGGNYPQPLQVKVLDAAGNPVADATVTFTMGAGAGGASACAATSGAAASFIGGAAQASTTTGSSGLATSPPFAANDVAGSFTAAAAASSVGSAAGAGAGNAAGSGGAIQARFALTNIAGAPAKVAAGIAATESSAVGTRFPIGLAVTVTDTKKNPVAGASVNFVAPASGPGGRFTTHSRGSRHHRVHVSHVRLVKVRTDACGIAVAPPFTADRRQGGYVVKAIAGRARPAAFALVNEAPGQLP